MGGRGSSIVAKHIAGNDNKQADVITLSDPESDIHNDMFKKLKELDISTRKSTDAIDDVVLGRQQKQVYNIATKYRPILEKTTTAHEMQLGSEELIEGTLGYCELSFDMNNNVMQRIVLSKKHLADYDKIVNTVERAVDNNQFVPINKMFKSRDYLVTHELGHAIQNGMAIKRLQQEKKEVSIQSIAQWQKRMKMEVYDIYLKKYQTSENDRLLLSKYSGNDDAEWFAETFTNLELASEPAPIAKALGEYIGRYNR